MKTVEGNKIYFFILFLILYTFFLILDQISKLNNLYDTKFDQKLSSFINTMKNMDESIKNIQVFD